MNSNLSFSYGKLDHHMSFLYRAKFIGVHQVCAYVEFFSISRDGMIMFLINTLDDISTELLLISCLNC